MMNIELLPTVTPDQMMHDVQEVVSAVCKLRFTSDLDEWINITQEFGLSQDSKREINYIHLDSPYFRITVSMNMAKIERFYIWAGTTVSWFGEDNMNPLFDNGNQEETAAVRAEGHRLMMTAVSTANAIVGPSTFRTESGEEAYGKGYDGIELAIWNLDTGQLAVALNQEGSDLPYDIVIHFVPA